MPLRIALVVLYLCLGDLTRPAVAGAQRANDGRSTVRPRNRPLVLDLPPLKLVSRERLQRQTARLLGVAAAAPEYHCRVSEDWLNALLPPRVKFDAHFRDILVGVPVHGQSQTQGEIRADLVPDGEHASFDLCFTGSIQMAAVGHTRGVQIASDATTEFKAVKRMILDSASLRWQPAECHARSSLTIQRITNTGPRIMGRIVQRVAYRRAISTMSQAEKECSEHVEQAVREYVDQHLESIAEVVNVALRSHIRGLSDQDTAGWAKIHFCTNSDCLFVRRGTSSLPAWEQRPPRARSLVITMPRTGLGANARIAMHLLAAQDGPRSTEADRPALPFDGWPGIVLSAHGQMGARGHNRLVGD
jgi:hypothetical protein